jgi:hypothetical protein
VPPPRAAVGTLAAPCSSPSTGEYPLSTSRIWPDAATGGDAVGENVLVGGAGAGHQSVTEGAGPFGRVMPPEPALRGAAGDQPSDLPERKDMATTCLK